MKKTQKTVEKRCNNCVDTDEKALLVFKQLSKFKLENDELVKQLKQLGDESRKIIENLSFPAASPQQQKGENPEGDMIKEDDFLADIITQQNCKRRLLRYHDEISKITGEIEKAKAKNSELKKEQGKIVEEKDPKALKNEKIKEFQIIATQANDLNRQLEQKTENKQKLLKKIEELEAKHKEICSKNGVQPLVRPDFTVVEDVEGTGKKYLLKTESSKPTKKTAPNLSKSVQDIRQVKEHVPSPEDIIEAKEILRNLEKNIISFQKVHVKKMNDYLMKDEKVAFEREENLAQLEKLIQECHKAHLVIKELQNLPRGQFLESSAQKRHSDSSFSEEQLPIDIKTMKFNDSKIKKELHGAKLITDHAILFADYSTLTNHKSYKLQAMRIYHKEGEILRLEIDYLVQNGEVQSSIQPTDSNDILTEKDMKCANIKLARNENLIEITGIYDISKITFLKIKTSLHQEFQIGQINFGLNYKDFKYNISHIEKPLSFFGCFDIQKNGRKVLAQLGVEISKKDIIFKTPTSSKSVKGLQEAGFKSANKEIKEAEKK